MILPYRWCWWPAAGPRAELPERLGDVDALQQLLRQHGVIDAQAECFISGWLHLDTLLAELQLAGNSLQPVIWLTLARGLPVELPGDPAPVKDDCVLVRYLAGVAMRESQW